LRGTLFSIVPINIDDKNLTKNREQRIFKANMNLLCLRFWSVWNGLRILTYCRAWSDSGTEEV